MIKVRAKVGKQLSPLLKNSILAFERKIQIRNLIFILTLGAVKNDIPKVIVTRLSNVSPKSEARLSLLVGSIEQANAKKLWPVRFKLRLIDGMSGQSYRYVLNKLTSVCKNYLEIGTWRGSTACTALDGNQINAWIVDDWSEFGGPAGDALKNIAKFVGTNSRLTIISNDFNKVNYKQLLDSQIDVYLFDGPHSRKDHINGVKVIDELNFDSLIFVVDDWCWKDVQEGTLAGLERVNATLGVKVEVFPNSTNRFQYSRWHNGYCFFILER